ncbi:VOC family protein [Isoptericola sediminis]|uniref:Glyoxalase n=1 Tax=Isoptericola sediminis TaxID=2733572 RepID=A0A849K5J7_9MICO|nr:VOC family protein [Isoptericola sediminis]NNU28658.1 glyoxalase [Isoptericola sediminis]
MTTSLWVTLRYADADTALDWLRAVGFTERVVDRDEQDPTVVQHAELEWPGGGGLMLGTHRDSPAWPVEPGHGATYAVTDDVDGTYEAALGAGGRAVAPPADQPYGGRGASVADPEGNLWNFGSYRP